MVNKESVEKLQESLRGELILPHDKVYDETRKVYNGMIDRRPFTFRVDLHGRQRICVPRQLCLHLLKVVHINMGITQGENKITGFKINHLGNHHRQQCVRRDIEWNTQEYVCAALVHLAA